MAGKIVLLFAILAATLTSFCCSSRRIYTPTVKELSSSQQGSFGITKRNMYATVGDTVELHCYGARDFIYKLLWFKWGHKIRNYGKISFRNTSNDDYHESKITIKNITKNWSDEYVCKVTSMPGETAENKVYLHVIDRQSQK